MSGVLSNIMTLLGIVSMVSLLIAMILLLHLIQQAFERSGVLWGIISVVYPPGTYLYCRKNWDALRNRFLLISGLILLSLVLWAILRLAA